MTVDRAVLETFEALELNGELTHREQQLMEVCRQLRDENADRFIELAELTAKIQEARSQCRRERGLMCKLYEIDEGNHGRSEGEG